MNEPLTWRKSSFSNGGGGSNDCVELAASPGGGVCVRHSKLADASPVINYTQAEMRAFLLGVKAGEFDDFI